jgi:hypothetical protein
LVAFAAIRVILEIWKSAGKVGFGLFMWICSSCEAGVERAVDSHHCNCQSYPDPMKNLNGWTWMDRAFAEEKINFGDGGLQVTLPSPAKPLLDLVQKRRPLSKIDL